MQGQKKVLTKQTTIPVKAQQALYEVAYFIAQAKKPHMIEETLMKPTTIAISRAVHEDKLARELESVAPAHLCHGPGHKVSAGGHSEERGKSTLYS